MLIYGHRGGARGGRAPENTIPSFSLAKEMGVDGVELDVHLTKDGEVVVMHDAAVDRTTNGSGLISRMTMEEVRSWMPA